ncbi:MAG TPA: hypothetical protein VID72_00530 [Ktedonobacterales bacterium]
MGGRARDVYAQVYSFENLWFAERTAARGKRGRADVAAFEYHLEDELLQLQQDLRDKVYRPGPYRRHTVREPKERLISAAPFRDRVVHHALTRMIEPYFERRSWRAERGGPLSMVASYGCVSRPAPPCLGWILPPLVGEGDRG